MTNIEENQALSGNSPISTSAFGFARAAEEYNAIVAKIEAEFGAILRRRHSFKDQRDAELSLARIRATYRAMCKGWLAQQRADRACEVSR